VLHVTKVWLTPIVVDSLPFHFFACGLMSSNLRVLLDVSIPVAKSSVKCYLCLSCYSGCSCCPSPCFFLACECGILRHLHIVLLEVYDNTRIPFSAPTSVSHALVTSNVQLCWSPSLSVLSRRSFSRLPSTRKDMRQY
jgi:hypothetical protein